MEEPTAYHRRRRTQPPTTTASSRSPSSSSMAHNDASWDWDWDENGSESEDSAPSLAAKAIRASSAAQRASSLSSAYSQSSFSKPNDVSLSSFSPRKTQNPASQQYTSMKDLSESKHGFWSVLARKAKSMVEDDDVPENATASKGAQNHRPDRVLGSQGSNPSRPTQTHRKLDGAVLHKGLGAIASSLNYIGGTIGNALEEGITLVENRTADIMQETRRLNIRKKGDTPDLHKQVHASSPRQKFTLQHQMQPPVQSDLEIQLKASRDVAMAMAAKTKLLLRELKTVKADFAFAKERCAQLEEENRILRQSVEKGNNPEDDDLIRLQLETLLAEKARLAHENTVYARENRFLREIVEYHQLTMQDVVYVNENSEEVSEVYPTKLPSSAAMPPLSYSSSSDFKHGQVT